ncbi:zinc-binding dehydrogenase [Herbidospora sp. NBRC 101105]|uniref:quinone oxidoreductase family protein n=1 Tax=Herbidospora sp. NBRC 101105 TaxID=3032195 RepID=UPI0024A5AC37|nr:zinc-binding dehydrogenase [Herbidospora sp. NBRC 101105]GLX95391.1 NADPH:quinone reductase [Herbidospora sp. NBRC 101105]
MKAVRVTRYGAPDVLEPADLPVPVPGEGEVAVDVTHAAVGLIDVLIRRGDFAGHGLPMQPPYTPGIEAAGTVRAVGAGVTTLRPGDRVATLSIAAGGGYAEVMIAPAAATFRLPDGLDPAQAVAALPNATTAVLALTRAITLPPDAKVLVTGATGALASVFPAIAKRLGAREVVGTVRSPARIAEAERLGFDRAVLFDSLDAPEFDVVIDPVGGELRGRALGLLADMGRLVAVGSADRSGHTIDSNTLWFGNRGIVGFAVGMFLQRTPALAAPAAAEAMSAIADGSIKLAVETYPLDRAADTHARMEAGGVSGRLVLTLG